MGRVDVPPVEVSHDLATVLTQTLQGDAVLHGYGMRKARVVAADLTLEQARFLVNLYYSTQDQRKKAESQTRELFARDKPAEFVELVYNTYFEVEAAIKKLLDAFTDGEETGLGEWVKGITGIGPILAAGLMAHIDPRKSYTSGQLWRFAGLDPTSEWGKGQKRPWNADLKKLCWLIGESFVKTKNRQGSFYGPLYEVRRQYEDAKNEAGDYAPLAAEILKKRNFSRDTQARAMYLQGKLPPAHIYQRCKRWTVKLFLAHYHHTAWLLVLGQEPVKPYVMDHLGHVDLILPPNIEVTRAKVANATPEMKEQMAQAYREAQEFREYQAALKLERAAAQSKSVVREEEPVDDGLDD